MEHYSQIHSLRMVFVSAIVIARAGNFLGAHNVVGIIRMLRLQLGDYCDSHKSIVILWLQEIVLPFVFSID